MWKIYFSTHKYFIFNTILYIVVFILNLNISLNYIKYNYIKFKYFVKIKKENNYLHLFFNFKLNLISIN